MGFTIYVCYQNDMNNFDAYCCSHYVAASIAMAFNIYDLTMRFEPLLLGSLLTTSLLL